jgi:hypothetical protein
MHLAVAGRQAQEGAKEEQWTDISGTYIEIFDL